MSIGLLVFWSNHIKKKIVFIRKGVGVRCNFINFTFPHEKSSSPVHVSEAGRCEVFVRYLSPVHVSEARRCKVQQL